MPGIRIGSRAIELSRLDKILFPDAGVTKGNVVDYYRGVADVMLRHAQDRALNLQRFPDGIAKQGFIQQQRPDYFPGWIDGVTAKRVGDKGGSVRHVVCNSAATLVYLADQAVITFHGWLSRSARLGNPDKLVFDLDPPANGDFRTVIHGARRVRELMESIGMTPFVMTTGSSGLHVVAPLAAHSDFDDARALARAMAEHLARRHPDQLTAEQRKNRRKGRVYLDIMRNSWGQTSVLPYSLRPRPGAPVATPLEWDELARSGLGPQTYTLKNLPRRLGQKGDPWAGIYRHRKSVAAARQALTALAGDEGK